MLSSDREIILVIKLSIFILYEGQASLTTSKISGLVRMQLENIFIFFPLKLQIQKIECSIILMIFIL